MARGGAPGLLGKLLAGQGTLCWNHCAATCAMPRSHKGTAWMPGPNSDRAAAAAQSPYCVLPGNWEQRPDHAGAPHPNRPASRPQAQDPTAEPAGGTGPRIVWATRFIPFGPFRGGDALYTGQLLRSLSRRAHIDVVCYDNGTPIPGNLGPNIAWHVVPWREAPRWWSVLHLLPNIAFQFDRPEFWQRVSALASGADAVYLDHLSMMGGVRRLSSHQLRGHGPPIILVTHNHETSLRKSMAGKVGSPLLRGMLQLDTLKAARVEAKALRMANAATAITDADTAAFRREHPGLPLLTLPPGYDGVVVHERRIASDGPRRAVLLGSTTAFHKRLVLEEALAGLAALDADAGIQVDVIGDIDDDFRAKATMATGGRLRVVGYAEDLSKELESARAAILADVIGGGFKLRALTLVFHRVPILAVAGALDGMGLTPGLHFLEYQDLTSLARAIPEVLADTERLNGLQHAAFEAFHGRFDWDSRAASLLDFAATLRDGPKLG